MAAWRAAVVLLLAVACSRPPGEKRKPPAITLWAWDRAEDLRFLKPGEAEVAALLMTVHLENGQYSPTFRMLPLHLPQGMKPLPVVRLEYRSGELPAPDSVAHQIEWLSVQEKTKTVQIDFDATSAQLAWYDQMLDGVREFRITPSITALASWCFDEPWFAAKRARLADTVPMLFRMGPDRARWLRKLDEKGAFHRECGDSIGIATDEPIDRLPPAKRVYVFHPKPWTKEAFDAVCARLR